LLKGTIGDIKALLNFSKKKKKQILREQRILEEQESEEPKEEEVKSKDNYKTNTKKKNSLKRSLNDKKEQIDSPFRLKPTWKSKSRQTSKKKKPRTASNKISEKRKRKFSNSKEKLANTVNNISPFPVVPHNTHANQFYSKNKKKKRNFTNVKDSKSKSRKKKSSNKKYHSKNKDSKTQTHEVILEGSSDMSYDALNLIIGDKNNELSQVYSNMGVEFGKKSVVLLKSIKLGYDMDYITGIQAEYYVGRRQIIEQFINDESSVEVLKIEDPSKIKGK